MKEFWGKNCQEHYTATIDAMINATKQDFDCSIAQVLDVEARNVMMALKKCVIEILEKLKKKTQQGMIIPELPLRLSIFDAPVEIPPDQKLYNKWRVGFFATVGDPVHWGHILTALRCAAEFDLNTIILQVMGDCPHKRMQKQPKEYRHAIARHAIEYFYPLIRYTPLGYDNLKVGEENAAEFLLLNRDLPLDLYFLAGWDVAQATLRITEACNAILTVVNEEEGKDLKIKLLLSKQHGASVGDVSGQFPDWVIFCKQEYTPLPKFSNIKVSSTLFRSYPDVPILPSRALAYIRKHGLYISRQKYDQKDQKEVKLDKTVILSYLTPTLHQFVEEQLTDIREVPPLIPHGISGKSGLLGKKRVTVFKAVGKETSILPVMWQPEVNIVLAIGICGALQTSLRPGDIILPTIAIRGEGITTYWLNPCIPAIVHSDVLESLRQGAKNQGIRTHSGPLYTTASIAQERQVLAQFAPFGILGVEMELALHLTLAMLHHKRAASIYVVSDTLAQYEEIMLSGISESEVLRESIKNAIDIIGESLIYL